MKAKDILVNASAIMDAKGPDYTSNPSLNQHENFERAAIIASWFSQDRDKPYAILIGVKIARLASLLSSGRKPNNEPLLDTFIDLVNYSALWGSAAIETKVEEIHKILNSGFQP